MRRVDTQIKLARKEAYSKDPTTTKGVAHNTILEYINDGQDILQSLISSAYAKFNIKEDTQNCVVNQENYSVTDGRVFLNNRFVSVELSCSGNLVDYIPLRKAGFLERDTDSGLPGKYIRRDAEILLNPIPDSATYKIRVNFEEELDDLDIRRGKITSVAGTGTSGDPITSITLAASNPTPDGTDTTLTDVDAGDYICVVDLDGNRIARNIPVTAYNTGSRILTVTNFELATNDTLPAANHYITWGKYTSTHSGLPDRCDNYLVLYTAWRILSHKKSTQFSEALRRRVAVSEKEIIDAYTSKGQELVLIPEIGDGLEI